MKKVIKHIGAGLIALLILGGMFGAAVGMTFGMAALIKYNWFLYIMLGLGGVYLLIMLGRLLWMLYETGMDVVSRWME